MPLLYDENRTNFDARIASIAARQHGVFARKQAQACGATEGTIRWRIETGRWEQVHPRVYRMAGSPTTWLQAAAAACLTRGPGAALSHRSAAALRAPLDARPPGIDVSVPRNRSHKRTPGVTVHWLSEPIPREDIAVVRGVPVTRPARTLLDLAATDSVASVETFLDDYLRRGLVSTRSLERWLDDERRARQRGARQLRRLIQARVTGGVTDSELERKVLRCLRKAGLPTPRLQHQIFDGDTFVGRVDFAYPAEQVAIEVDSYRHHHGRQSFDHDRARGNNINALGWQVLRFTSTHLNENPDAVQRWVRRALARAGR